jgi:hypothetical protein
MTKRPERIAVSAVKRLGLVTLLASLLVALVGLLTPPASASPLLHPETRVAAIAQPNSQLVGPSATVAAVQGRERAPSYDSCATGSSVAAEGDTLFRTGSQTDGSLTDPTGVSFRSSVSSSADGQQVFRPGAKIWSIDTGQLPPGSVDFDNDPDGHVSVYATPEEIRDAVIAGGSDNILQELGLKPLGDPGAYRLP